MVNRQKVIKGLKTCTEKPCYCTDCPYKPTCCLDSQEVMEDALELLKEQKAIEPIYIENPYTHLPVSYCPRCREPISKFITGNPYKETKYCHYCGQEVRWE